jgi:hypothetical protein
VNILYLKNKNDVHSKQREKEGGKKSGSITHSEWRLYSICRREKNKGDQFLIPMKLFRVTGALVSDLKMIAKKERKRIIGTGK